MVLQLIITHWMLPYLATYPKALHNYVTFSADHHDKGTLLDTRSGQQDFGDTLNYSSDDDEEIPLLNPILMTLPPPSFWSHTAGMPHPHHCLFHPYLDLCGIPEVVCTHINHNLALLVIIVRQCRAVSEDSQQAQTL